MLTEKTLDQILGVLELTKRHYTAGAAPAKAYQKSVKEIARRDAVRYQTIADGCRRRLDLDNINEFMVLLKEWLRGEPRRLKALLAGHIQKTDEYKLDDFFARQISATSSSLQGERKVEDLIEVIALKTPRNTAEQLRTLAESAGKSLDELAVEIIKKYVDENYVLYLKELINSLPPERRQVVIASLTEKVTSK